MTKTFSPELRQVLTRRAARQPEAIVKEVADSVAYSRGERPFNHYDPKRVEQLTRQLADEATGALFTFTGDVDALEQRIESLSDAAFEQELNRLNREAVRLLERIKRYPDDAEEGRRYCHEFTHVDEVHSIETFLERRAQHWIPRKQDIARIVGLAVDMHKQLIETGMKDPNQPIRILDIGGSNGFLAQLILRHAKESGIPNEGLRIDVVDPDAPSIGKAALAYQENKELHFFIQNAAQHAEAVHAGDPVASKLLQERKQFTEQWKESFDFLARLETIFEQDDQNKEVSDDTYLMIMDSVHNNLIASVISDRAEIKTVGDLLSWLSDVREQLKEKMNIEMENMNGRTEYALVNKRPDYDLVLNSWMPPGIDFTRDIRAVNGAAILYTMERLGATGIQPAAEYPSKPKEPGEEGSYDPGYMYAMHAVWVGPGTPEVNQKISGQHSFWGVPDASNGFIVEVRHGCPTPEIKEPQKLTPYPWEAAVGKVYEFSDRVEYFDYYTVKSWMNFYNLMRDIVSSEEENEHTPDAAAT